MSWGSPAVGTTPAGHASVLPLPYAPAHFAPHHPARLRPRPPSRRKGAPAKRARRMPPPPAKSRGSGLRICWRRDNAIALARAAAEGRELSLSPLTETPAARDAPALAQAADDFRSGFIKLNGKKAIAVLDEELLMTRGVERVVRTIGQPYRRAPPILIQGLPAPGTDEDAIDPEVAAQVAADEEARQEAESRPFGNGIQDHLLSLAPSPTWSSAHPIPPIPPLRKQEVRMD